MAIENATLRAVHTQELRHFLDGIKWLDSSLGRRQAQLLVDVRFHQVGEVHPILSLGQFNWREAIRVGDVRVSAMSQEQFDHFGRTFVNGYVESGVPADHAVFALGGRAPLVWVRTEFRVRTIPTRVGTTLDYQRLTTHWEAL